MESRIMVLKSFLENEPGDPFLNYALALELIKQDKLQEAEAVLEKLLGMAADYLPAYYQAGRVKELLGKHNEAKNIYQAGMILARSVNDRHTYNELVAAAESMD